ncbi:MAG: DnaJ domain-containing protein [Fusobacteriota bacterium]
MDKYLKELGLKRGVKKDQIKKAYRKLAAQYHPDKNEGNDLQHLAQKKFMQIKDAYEYLIQNYNNGYESERDSGKDNDYNSQYYEEEDMQNNDMTEEEFEKMKKEYRKKSKKENIFIRIFKSLLYFIFVFLILKIIILNMLYFVRPFLLFIAKSGYYLGAILIITATIIMWKDLKNSEFYKTSDGRQYVGVLVTSIICFVISQYYDSLIYLIEDV